MDIYNIFGEFINIEKFTENTIEEKDLTDFNIYSHFVFASPDGKIRLTIFPLYHGEKGHFNLSLKGDKDIKNYVVKTTADSSYLNNPRHIDKLLVDGVELDRNLFKSFRIYDGKLQMIDNGNYVNLNYDFENNKITNLDKPSNLYLFDFSLTGSEVNVFNNDPQASFYKVNISRNTFYLTTDIDRKDFVKTNYGITNNKEEASIFTFKEIDPNQIVKNPTRINIPPIEKDPTGRITNSLSVDRARTLKILFDEAHKYNLLELVKNINGEFEEAKLKLIKDEIRGTVVFVSTNNNENYQLHVWIKEN